jgi:hypothetical protein
MKIKKNYYIIMSKYFVVIHKGKYLVGPNKIKIKRFNLFGTFLLFYPWNSFGN